MVVGTELFSHANIKHLQGSLTDRQPITRGMPYGIHTVDYNQQLITFNLL